MVVGGLITDDRKLTDEAEIQGTRLECRTAAFLTWTNQVSLLDEPRQQAWNSTHTRTDSLTFSTVNIFSSCKSAPIIFSL